MTTPVIIVEQSGSIGHVMLNQPDNRNALTPQMRAALRAALDDMMADDGVAAVVVSGSGKTFCAGGDLKSLVTETGSSMLERQRDGQKLVQTIAAGAKPTIAAVEGAAVGAGLSIALACDVVVASVEARFSAVFGKVGLVADLGLTWTLPRRVGIGRARLMALSGRSVGAEQAAGWGLVDELVPAGSALAAAFALAAEVAATAPIAREIARRALAQPFASLGQALEFESLAQSLLIGTEDFAEGFAAFQEKRPTRFSGR
jgi:enoyl-CoA hydratase/carnithine racemase